LSCINTKGGYDMKIVKLAIMVLCVFSLANTKAGTAITQKVDFYGHFLNVSFDQDLRKINFIKLDQSEINSKLKYFRNANLSNSVSVIKNYTKAFDLDDAGVVLLVDKAATSIAGSRNNNEQVFTKYIMLKQLGYDVILTRTENNKLNCMGNISFTPGRYIYINYASRRYVDLDFKNRKNYSKHLIIIDGQKTFKTIARNIISTPKVDAHMEIRHITFSYGINSYDLDAKSNKSITEFLGDLPMFEVGNAFTNLSVSKEMNESVVQYLRNQVVGMDKVEATKFLLAFVQQVVPYGSDYTKYGEERFYYPEETIMAADADCEDKAILLAYLAKRILGIQSVGLFFENDRHLSLALQIPDYSPSIGFKYNGKTYVSCEPTGRYPHLGVSQFALSRVTEVVNL
jgi:hypothetical protein